MRPKMFIWMLLSVLAMGAVDCAAQPAASQQLTFASGTAIPHLKNVTFSESDRYVALEGDDLVVVFDLVANREVMQLTRETPVRAFDSLHKPQSLAFDPHDQFFIFRDGKLLKECTFLGHGACKTIASDLGGGFDVSESGLLAYISGSDTFCIRPLSQSPSSCRFLPTSIPNGDRKGFATRYVHFSQDSKKIATAGVIDRPLPGSGGKSSDDTYEEWRTSVYDLSSGLPDIRYEQLNLFLDDLRFTLDSHLVACGRARSGFSGAATSGYAIWDVTANQKAGTTIDVKIGRPLLTADASGVVVMNSATGISKVSIRTGEYTSLLRSDFTPPFNGGGSRLWISPSTRIILYSNFTVPGKADIYRLLGPPAS